MAFLEALTSDTGDFERPTLPPDGE